MKDIERYIVAIGSSSIDTYYDAPYWPALGDKIMVKSLGSRVGGLVSNAACAMAACGLNTYLIDTVNPDARDAILSELDKYGVKSDYILTGDRCAESGTNIILVNGERVIFVSKNKPEFDLPSEHKELLYGAAGLYSIIPEIKNIREHFALLKSIKQRGVKLFWDMEPATFGDSPEDRSLMRMADILFFNEWGMKKYGGQNMETSAAQLLEAGVRAVVVTLAEKGCVVFTGGREIRVAGVGVDVKDTTGAGDAFNSVFLRGYMEGWDWERTARMANAAGARAVTLMGPKSGAVPLDVIERFSAMHP